MIDSVILDIDGVLVGGKVDYNSPWPHPDVIQKIKTINASGTPVILCTGKPHYAIGKIITDCNLQNPHITDGGSVIIDPINRNVVKKHVIDKKLVAAMVQTFLAADMYTELYTPDEYIIQKSQFRKNLTPVHSHVLQREPKMVDSLLDEVANHDVIKVMGVATDENDAKRLMSLYAPFAHDSIISMGLHHVANPHQFGAITAKGISKRQSAIDVMETLKIDLVNCLGVGDATSDWQFMELTGYAATLANGSDEIKNHVRSKGKNGYITPMSVDENGILDILNHFQL